MIIAEARKSVTQNSIPDCRQRGGGEGDAPQPVSPLRYDSGLYVPVYRGDTTRIIIGKG